ncbi:MAG: class I SAM-dependent methyltransferase [Melioribacteraceae bacterium]
MRNKNKSLLPAGTFYNEISDFYEKMIDFDKNLELRTRAYQKIFRKKGRAADIGCGVGLDSLALALNGHVVHSFDISPRMIEETGKNAVKYGVRLEARVSSYETLSKSYNKKFDYVISVGNTIAHVDSSGLRSAVRKMYGMLVPGGKIFLHILNYPLIIKENRRINNIANRGGKVIIRFYDFAARHLNFNILSFMQDSPKQFQLVTTKHFPHSNSEIASYLKGAGFGQIEFMSNFTGDKFDFKKSKDLFIEAVKKL